LVSTTCNAQTFNYNDKRIDSIIYSKIESIPEVDKFVKTKRIENASIFIAERPDKTFKYYWVQVGIVHPDRFEPVLNFYITPNKFDVLYYDTETDAIWTLQRWRENNNKH
jgi:hypothetical protein